MRVSSIVVVCSDLNRNVMHGIVCRGFVWMMVLASEVRVYVLCVWESVCVCERERECVCKKSKNSEQRLRDTESENALARVRDRERARGRPERFGEIERARERQGVLENTRKSEIECERVRDRERQREGERVVCLTECERRHAQKSVREFERVWDTVPVSTTEIAFPLSLAWSLVRTHERTREYEFMSHMNESCLIWMSHVAYEWVMSHMNESCLIWMSHVSYEWAMSHMNESCLIWVSQERILMSTNMSHRTKECSYRAL